MAFSLGSRILFGRQRMEGVHIGRTLVKSGAHLCVAGLVIGNMVIEPGARVHLKGFLIGNIVDRGGDVNVDGSMLGRRVAAAAGHQDAGKDA